MVYNFQTLTENKYDLGGVFLASIDQLKLVGMTCDYYRFDSLYMSTETNMPVSCETCAHWTGRKCDIDVFDNVLAGLDQT